MLWGVVGWCDVLWGGVVCCGVLWGVVGWCDVLWGGVLES